MRSAISVMLLSCLALGALACGPSEPTSPATGTASVEAPPPSAAAFRVTGIELGRAIGPEQRISAPTSIFTAGDTIYASVATEGSASQVTLTARWIYEDGQLVNERSEVLAPTGPAMTEFHITKPEGWPTGRYQLEIALDGRPAGSRRFEVR